MRYCHMKRKKGEWIPNEGNWSTFVRWWILAGLGTWDLKPNGGLGSEVGLCKNGLENT